MSHLRVAGATFAIERAVMVAYHCASEEADWNLELVHEGVPLWLAGTVAPGPSTIDALDGAQVSVDLRSLDEVVGALLDRAVTLYPNGQGVCALTFRLVRNSRSVRFVVDCECDWDRDLATFEATEGVALSLDIDAEVAALHPGPLPEDR
jgi:hypothetical protein